MATLSTIKGRRIIQAKDAHGKRRTIGLGRVSKADAELIRAHVAELESSLRTGITPRHETREWLGKIGDDLHAKIVKAGFASGRVSADAPRLGKYFTAYIARRTDLRSRTLSNLEQSRTAIVGYFGADRDMRTITVGEVKDFKRKMLEGFAVATVAMHIKKARQVFSDAVDHKTIESNPFKDRTVKAGRMDNPDRQQYIAAADIAKVIDSTNDMDWKLVFALARYQGLRIPSELRTLKWTDIFWDQHKMRVKSTKTNKTRIMPIFPATYKLLSEAIAKAEDNAVFVINRLRLRDNLGTIARRIIEDRAGLEVWEKTFQNLRASCETDLVASFPVHVACTWIGNSAAVATKHYLQVTEADFDAASGRCKSAAQDTEQTPVFVGKTDDTYDVHYPLGSFNNPRGALQAMQKSHEALQRALHGVTNRASRERSRMIKNLAAAVKAARRRGGHSR